MVKIILNSAGLANATPERWQKKARSCNRIHIPIEGKAIYHDLKKKCILSPGNAYVLVNSMFENLELFPDCGYYHFYIDFSTVPPFLNREALTVDLSTDEFLAHLLGAIEVLIRESIRVNNRTSVYKIVDETRFEQVQDILKVIVRRLQEESGLETVQNEMVKDALQFISEHYNEQICSREIAEALHITPRYLIRLFQREVGISTYQYLTQYRVERGVEFLAGDKSRTVAEAAFACGFQTENAFRIACKKIMGKSPKSYLNRDEGKSS